MNKCEITNDLLPAYIDEVISPSGKEYVEEHISECAECTATLEKMRIDVEEKKAADSENLRAKRPFKAFNKRIVIGIAATVLCSFLVFFAVLAVNIYNLRGFDGLSQEIFGIDTNSLATQRLFSDKGAEISSETGISADSLNEYIFFQLWEKDAPFDKDSFVQIIALKNDEDVYFIRAEIRVNGIGSCAVAEDGFEILKLNEDGYCVFSSGNIITITHYDDTLDNYICTLDDNCFTSFQSYSTLTYYYNEENIEAYINEKYKNNGYTDEQVEGMSETYRSEQQSIKERLVASEIEQMRRCNIPENVIEEWKSK